MGSKSFSPSPGPQKNALFGAESTIFGADVHDPKGSRKTLYKKKVCVDFLALFMCFFRSLQRKSKEISKCKGKKLRVRHVCKRGGATSCGYEQVKEDLRGSALANLGRARTSRGGYDGRREDPGGVPLEAHDLVVPRDEKST